MLIDGIAESQWPADYENGVAALREYPMVTKSFSGWNADDVEGDLTCVFRGMVTGYTRSLLFIKPDILVLYDKIKSNEPHFYSWLFHAEHTDGKSSITYRDKTMRIDRPKARLDMKVVAPEIASGRVRMSDRDESFLTLTSNDGLRDTEFLAVLRPQPSTGPSEPVKKLDAEVVRQSGWIGTKVYEEERETLAMFRSGAEGKVTVEGCATDAERFAVMTKPDGSPMKLFLRGSDFEGKGAKFRSLKPVTASVTFTDEKTQLEADSPGTEIGLRLSQAPEEVRLNGEVMTQWKFNTPLQELSLTVPGGHVIVDIK
jgi:hypothetical protein